jgi:BON domain-containing protein
MRTPKEAPMRIRTIALVSMAGAAVVYLFDPISGSARRTRLRGQIMGFARRAARRAPIVETARTPLPENVVPEPKAEISDTPDEPKAEISDTPDEPKAESSEAPDEPSKQAIPLGPGALPMDDAAIAGRIRTQVFGRPDLETGGVLVDVVRGMAFLRGELRDGHAIEEIIDRTRSVPGVRGVQNLIVIRMPESVTITRPIRTLGDTWSG